MSRLFEKNVREIHAETGNWTEADMGFNGIHIVDETPESILVYDYTDDGWEHIYRIWDSDAMTKDWLRERIIVTQSLRRAGVLPESDMDALVDWIFTSEAQDARDFSHE